jgi:hypothetical protein
MIHRKYRVNLTKRHLTFYDSEKARIPAWCDRILWRGNNLRQTNYQTADLKVSDHRPVWATFDCAIDIVDHALKESLRRSIYEEKQGHGHTSLADSVSLLDMDDDESPHISIAPGLPPASSDRSRWWLDNGECFSLWVWWVLLIYDRRISKSNSATTKARVYPKSRTQIQSVFCRCRLGTKSRLDKEQKHRPCSRHEEEAHATSAT